MTATIKITRISKVNGGKDSEKAIFTADESYEDLITRVKGKFNSLRDQLGRGPKYMRIIRVHNTGMEYRFTIGLVNHGKG